MKTRLCYTLRFYQVLTRDLGGVWKHYMYTYIYIYIWYLFFPAFFCMHRVSSLSLCITHLPRHSLLSLFVPKLLQWHGHSFHCYSVSYDKCWGRKNIKYCNIKLWLQIITEILLLFGRKDACCIHPLIPTMLIFLVKFVVFVCVFCILVITYQREHTIFVFWGLAHFTMHNGFPLHPFCYKQ